MTPLVVVRFTMGAPLKVPPTAPPAVVKLKVTFSLFATRFPLPSVTTAVSVVVPPGPTSLG